jgi:hypothetical protein
VVKIGRSWEPGAHVLDVACGAGYPALTAAMSVRPGGKVLATDISPLMLQASGFSDVCVDSYPMTVECASVAEYCQIFADVAWKARIAALSDAEVDRFREGVAKAAEPFMHGGRLRFVATSLCASGRK